MKAGPFVRALSYFPAIRRRWLKGMLCIIPTSGLEFMLPLIVAHVVDGVLQDTMDIAGVASWTLAAVAITLVKGAGKFGMRWYITGASREFERIYRQDYFQHLMRLTPRDLSHLRTGDLMSRSVADVEAVRMMLGPGLMYVSQAAIVIPTALTIMAFIDAPLTLVMLIPFIGLATVIRVAAKPTQHWGEATQERIAELSVVAQENFSGVRVVKAFATEAVSAGVFRRMGRSLLEANMRLATIRGVTSASITAIKDFGALVILLVGGWHVVQGTLSLGNLLLFLMILSLALWPLIAIGWMLAMYHRAAAGARRLDEVFDLVPSVQEPQQPAELGAFRGEMEARHLTFGWGEVPTIQDISFTVKAGGTLGITGRTGCGKTTLVQLLSRLVDPPIGTVFVDGNDIRSLPLDHLRKHIGVVPQDTFLFSETVAQNIAFAGDHIAGDRVLEVAQLAAVHDDIMGFRDGYDELLGERGVTLSGGQRQRTAIARGLAADPPVIILDDCLSAVDSVTEQAILRTLRETLTGRTAIIVSHRVSALSLADEVLVLDEGCIVERGTHTDLVECGGLYATLAERQRLEAEIEEL
jgi:ATP-binding cassette subfamily B multidrug efflux pump